MRVEAKAKACVGCARTEENKPIGGVRRIQLSTRGLCAACRCAAAEGRVKHPPKVGQVVRLKFDRRYRRRVERLLSDISGGVVLDAPVQGFCFWNMNDLIYRTPRKPR